MARQLQGELLHDGHWPAFVAVQAVEPGVMNVLVPLIEDTTTIDPPTATLRWGIVVWTVRYAPRGLTAMVRSHSSGLRSSIGAQTSLMLAFATTTSSGPKKFDQLIDCGRHLVLERNIRLDRQRLVALVAQLCLELCHIFDVVPSKPAQ